MVTGDGTGQSPDHPSRGHLPPGNHASAQLPPGHGDAAQPGPVYPGPGQAWPPPPAGGWPARFAVDPGLTLEEILRPAGVRQTLTFIDAEGTPQTVSYGEFDSRLAAAAHRLAEHGVRPGDRVATVITTSLRSVVQALAVWRCGATLVSLPPPPRRALRDEYVARFRTVLAAMDCQHLITEGNDSPLGGGLRTIPAAALATSERLPCPGAAVPPVALIQFTSGSLGSPKGVTIGREILAQHLNMISRCMGCDPAEDVMSTWLPFYHDFGLVCFFLTGVCARVSQTHMHPRRFASDPSSWLRMLADVRATITGAPHFGFMLASRVPYPAGLDLSRVRVALNGGERIHWDDLEEFGKAAGPCGFAWEALLPVYGLAENTVGVTCTLRQRTGPARGPGGLVSCGRPLPGTTLRCDGSAAAPAELRVGGRWLFDGYYTGTGFVPRAGAELATGDVGFLDGGQAYVLGRRSEVISVGGRNIFAEDIEVIAAQAGRPWVQGCAAFKLAAAGQRFGLCVEAGPRDVPDATMLAKNIRAAVSAELGTRVEPLLVVIPGAIPRTTSGKVQRGQCRAVYQSGALAAGARKVIAELS
jgi:fatty-acyl-CoA synthase